MLYIVPLTVSVSPSLVHVTVVAGESVEVQVRVREAESYVRLDTVGGAEEMNNVVDHLVHFKVTVCTCEESKEYIFTCRK